MTEMFVICQCAVLCCCRIYVKKVRKFLDCAVDITVDKKQLKLNMDHAFQSIKDCYTERVGHDRSVSVSNELMPTTFNVIDN